MCSGKFLWKTNQSYPRRGLLVGGISIHWTVGISMVHFLDRCGRVQTIWVVPAWEGGPGLCKKLPALSFCPGFLRWWTITCKANNSLSPSVAFGSGVYQSERVDCRNFQTAILLLMQLWPQPNFQGRDKESWGVGQAEMLPSASLSMTYAIKKLAFLDDLFSCWKYIKYSEYFKNNITV